jgi:guanylate kinase
VKAHKKQNRPGKLFIISGPSGSGKTTLLAGLIKDKKIGKLLVKSRSLTTRPRRTGESNGSEYFFVTPLEFRHLLKAKKILEWTRYLGYYYGTPKGPLEIQLSYGRNIGLCLDIKGARTLKKLYPNNTVTIFILPPSLEVLKSRIEYRSSSTNKKEIARRVRLARRELLAASEFDHCILNQSLQVALEELKNIFLHEINT